MKESERSSIALRITYIGLVINIILSSFKLFAGIFGNSNAMVADAVHSISDFATDIVVIASFYFFVSKPGDEDHSYGHGKFETFATFLIGAALFAVGAGIFFNGAKSVYYAYQGMHIESPGKIALIAAFVSIIFKEALYRVTASAGKKINSDAVIANAWHHRSDAFSSIGTAAGIGGAIFLGEKFRILDPLAGIIVSFFIVKVAIGISFQAVNELLEKSLPKKMVGEIRCDICAISGVKDLHNLKTRKIGNSIAIDAHILVDPKLSVTEGHDISMNIENCLAEKYGSGIFVSIHVEPFDH
ncbi:MAG TPA: cation diffusion facilitator family transporter [Spirochaetota bacterium]|jgi:cation diffusion facilitator family transporter|nr:cation diffusion facilitator family transporter [Spirochaetota bacterium]